MIKLLTYCNIDDLNWIFSYSSSAHVLHLLYSMATEASARYSSRSLATYRLCYCPLHTLQFNFMEEKNMPVGSRRPLWPVECRTVGPWTYSSGHIPPSYVPILGEGRRLGPGGMSRGICPGNMSCGNFQENMSGEYNQ